MKQYVNFQYRPKGASRPQDEPLIFNIPDDPLSPAWLPNVGDHVSFMRQVYEGQEQVNGVVESRLFSYLARGHCAVNIVVTDSDVDWGKIIKE
ncbi:MAG: hypothetical protein LDL44_00220 [Caenispirillum sp.]|nr:hypothetical protein [Caenispirillum sp.]